MIVGGGPGFFFLSFLSRQPKQNNGRAVGLKI